MNELDRVGRPEDGEQSTKVVMIEFVGAAEVVDDVRYRMTTRRVPHVLRKLVVANLRAVLVPALGDAQVHALSMHG
jgi:hypothetical protein